MKSLDKKKPSELFEGVNSTLHQAFIGAVERDKKKTKELKWIKDWKQLNPNWTEVQISFIGSLLQDLEEEIRVQQRTELLEEILGLECLKEENESGWKGNSFDNTGTGNKSVRNNLRKEIKEKIKKL